MAAPPVATRAAAARTLALPELATTLSALHGTALTQFIVAQKFTLWPFLCQLIPDWAFCWQELGEVNLNSDGTFSAEICFWCPTDFPDLYFEVIQNINGTEREISDPPIACSTYYDYDGSQEVVITVDDPQAVACLDGGGGPNYLYVQAMGIFDVDLNQVVGLETELWDNTVPNKGKVPLTAPLGSLVLAPWGGTLPLIMDFHPGMFGYYYRWSYKFDGDANFTPIFATVTHRYRVIDSYVPFLSSTALKY